LQLNEYGGRMVTKETLSIKSTNGINDLYVVLWKPEGSPKGVIQISHGMIEHIGRYSEFAERMADRGFLVVGNDHLAHGRTVKDKSELGFFTVPKGMDAAEAVLKDLHKVTEYVKNRYPDIPYFIFGHSMGSFFARAYVNEYYDELSGAMMMGTGDYDMLPLIAGKFFMKVFTFIKGERYHSSFLSSAFSAANMKGILSPRTNSDWLSTDPERVDAYEADPLNRFTFSVNGFSTLLDIIIRMETDEHEALDEVNDRKEIGMRTYHELPIAFLSGSSDPVGNFGKSPRKVARRYKMMGYRHVSLKIFKGDRHELLNEKDRDEVMDCMARAFEKWL